MARVQKHERGEVGSASVSDRLGSGKWDLEQCLLRHRMPRFSVCFFDRPSHPNFGSLLLHVPAMVE